MDLLDLTPTSDVVVVTLTHPSDGSVLCDDEKKPMTITIYAPHSKEYKKVLYEQTNKRLKQSQSKGRMEFTAEELDRVGIELLAKTTKEWHLLYKGENPKLSIKKAEEVYQEVFWIKGQIEEEVANYLSFMKA